jgi:hypothetical protein
MPDQPPPADDFPETTWVKLRILPGDTPRAIRMRHFLKSALRAWGIKCEGFSGPTPTDAANDPGNQPANGQSGEPGG